MEDKKSIINPELHSLVNKNKKMKFDKEFKTYKKPFLGRILDKFGNFCELFSEKVTKRPIFFYFNPRSVSFIDTIFLQILSRY